MSGRIRHPDALRAFAMLFGLFVHAEGLLGPPASGSRTAALIGLAPPISRITGGTQDWTVQETLRYLPFFALGVALRNTPALSTGSTG